MPHAPAELPPATPMSRALRWAYPIACGLAFGISWLAYRDFWLDDAFITFRYARNLADGFGPVFNPGEAVEGYTNFAWMLISAVAFAMFEPLRALTVLKWSGLGFGLAILWRGYTFPEPTGSGAGATTRGARRWLVGLLALNPIFIANCGDGLETPLYTLLLLELARACVRPASRATGIVAGLLAAAAVWTRPESLPLLVAFPALVALCRTGAARARWLRGFALAAALPVLGQLLFRRAYYGAWLPNTYYAKATGALGPRLETGLADLRELASSHLDVPAVWLWVVGAFAAVAIASALRRPRSREADLWFGALLGLVVFRVAFDVWSGGEFMGVFRFLAPALPPLVILADEGVRRLPRGRAVRATVAILAAAAAGAGFLGHAVQAEAWGRYERGLREAHIALGTWLAETRPRDTVVALGDAGAIPFFSQLRVVDLWGLADATIAKLPGEYRSRPGTVDYALGREPDLVVLWNRRPIRNDDGSLRIVGGTAFDRALAEHPSFRRDYEFVREWTFRPMTEPGTGYYLDVFERRSAKTRRR